MVGTVVGFAVLCLASFGLLVCWRRWRRAEEAVLKRILPPLNGPETSLVVTDIESSTRM